MTNANADRLPSGPKRDLGLVSPSKLEILLTAVFGMACGSYGAVHLGKGVSWDQRNYHHYDAFAWLSGAGDFHFAPAGMHSWMNPLVYVPQYWIVNHAPPVVAGAIFGCWVGLNFALVYTLSRIVLTGCSRRLAMGLAFLCAAVGFWDPYVIEMLGTSDVDNLLSLLVLGSLCLLCRAVRPEAGLRESQRALAWAGVLLGAAAGLKWTFFVYAVGAALALVALSSSLRLDRKRFLWFGAGGILGYLPVGGYWNWVLWSSYGNPFFPYWNRYFLSPYGVRSNYRDVRFVPESFEVAISYPFKWFLGLPIEEAFHDARYAVLFILISLVLAAAIGEWMARRWMQRRDHREERTERPSLAGREQTQLLLAFFLFSYLLWLYVFAIQRYLSSIGLITGLLLLLVLDRLMAGLPSKLASFCLIACFSLFWMQADLRSWRVPTYGSSWFGLELPPELQQPNSLLLLLGVEPTGYVVPYLPESVRGVRLLGSVVQQDGTETELSRRAEQIISRHSGPIRTLASEPLKESDLAYFKRFGLALQGNCVEFRSDVDRFTSCPVTREPVPASQDKRQGN